MADLPSLLAALELDPDDAQLYEATALIIGNSPADVRASLLATTRGQLAARGRPDAVERLLELELAATEDIQHQADLFVEKAILLNAELLDVAGARQALASALERRSGDAAALDALSDLELAEANWSQFARKYAHEAAAATDRSLATGLYVSAAEYYLRFLPDAPEAERWLRQALELDRSHTKAGFHLGRLLRRVQRWNDLARLLEERAQIALASRDRAAAWIALADLALGPLHDPECAGRAIQRVLEQDPTHPRAVRIRSNMDVALLGPKTAANRDETSQLKATYAKRRQWRELIALLDQEAVGLASAERHAKRLEMARIAEERIGDLRLAIELYNRALVEAGGSDIGPAVAALENLYSREKRHLALVEIVHRQVDAAVTATPHNHQAAVAALEKLGHVYAELVDAPEHAMQAWRRALELDPARETLDRLTKRTDSKALVAQLYKVYLEQLGGEPADVRQVALALASICESDLGDLEGAVSAYGRALRIEGAEADPDVRQLVVRLEDLAGRIGRWHDFVAVCGELATRADSKALRLEVLVRRARALEEHLYDPAAAAVAWQSALDLVQGDRSPEGELRFRDAFAHLERLYRQVGQWRRLAELFEMRIAWSTDPHEAFELRLSLGAICEGPLDNVGAAIEHYCGVLSSPALGDRAVRALENLIVHDEHRERLIELLEQIYRTGDQWQKLVAILDAKLEFVRDPLALRAALHEIAAIHVDRGGALDVAFAALKRAWRIDVSDQVSLAKLLSLTEMMGAWDTVVRLLEDAARELSHSRDPLDRRANPLAGALWARAAEIHEVWRGDRVRAIEAWRNVDAAVPDDLPALAALDRLLELEGRDATSHSIGGAAQLGEHGQSLESGAAAIFTELAQVIERRADLIGDMSVRLILLHRAAALYEDALRDPDHAIAGYQRVLDVDGTDHAAIDALSRLFRNRGDARSLVAMLERKLEVCSNSSACPAIHHSAAEVYETQLDDAEAATRHLVAALAEDASDRVALTSLDRIYTQTQQWAELIEVIDRRAALAVDLSGRAALALRAAKLNEVELADLPDAVKRYGDLLQLMPSLEPARIALERLMKRDDLVDSASAYLEPVYVAERNVEGLRRVYERRLGVVDREPAMRSADWQALAEMYEHVACDPAAGFAVWGRALADDPERVELVASLVRLAEMIVPAPWGALASILDERLQSQSLSPGVAQTYAMHLGRIAEERRNELDRAAAAYERASCGPEPREPLASLERVLTQNGDSARLATVLARQAELADNDGHAAEYMFRRAELLETRLASPRDAIRGYRDVLGLLPAHPAARSALVRLLGAVDDAADRGAIADVLEPLFEHDGDTVSLIAVLEVRVAAAADFVDRSELLQRIAMYYATELDEPGRALEASLRWLATDPGSVEAQSQIFRLVTQPSQWRDIERRVTAIAVDASAPNRGPEAQVALLTFLGDLQRQHLGDHEAAIATYRAALEIDPEAIAALDSLIGLLRRAEAWSALADALRQRGNFASEPSARRAAFAEVAELNERAGDRFGAIAAWRTVANEDPTDGRALAELARIYRSSSIPDDRIQLIEVLDRAAELATSVDDEKRVRVEIAQLETDSSRAIAAWQMVVDLDPSDAGALLQLQTAFARAADWLAVADIQARRLDVALTPRDKLSIYEEMAQTAETKQGLIDDAISAWYSALDVDATSPRAFDELERLLDAANRHHERVDLLKRRAELADSNGEPAARTELLVRAADVWAGKLVNPEAATEILEALTSRDPGCVPAWIRIAAIYSQVGDWSKCRVAAHQALHLHPTGRDAADLYFCLGSAVLEVGADTNDEDRDAVRYYHLAMQHDANHAPSIAALERIARQRGEHDLLVDMLRRRLETLPPETGAEARLGLLIEIAEVERTTGRNEAALSALAAAMQVTRDDVRVLSLIADIHAGLRRYDEAAAMYGRLASDAMAARRMKDVATFRFRQGSAHEARGDQAAALAAYEEAQGIHPTDIATMAALGRLYAANADWENARRIYQSLVLQNLDADTGISKADVYWALGRTHLELGDAAKAKAMWQRGLEIDPTHEELRGALRQMD
jgi:tetratricopeptide (TPR) repeat protein